MSGQDSYDVLWGSRAGNVLEKNRDITYLVERGAFMSWETTFFVKDKIANRAAKKYTLIKVLRQRKPINSPTFKY